MVSHAPTSPTHQGNKYWIFFHIFAVNLICILSVYNMETTNVEYLKLEYAWPYFIHLKLPLKFEINLKNSTWDDIYKTKGQRHWPLALHQTNGRIRLQSQHSYNFDFLIYNFQEIYKRQTGKNTTFNKAMNNLNSRWRR